MMQLIRSTAGKILVPFIIVLFLGWMVFEIGMDALGGGLGGPRALGSVNGQEISPQLYQERYQALYQQALQQGGDVTPEMARRLEEDAWEQLVNETLVRQELARRGIRVTDQEIVWAAQNLPAPGLSQQEIFLTNGQFDIAKYRQFLATQAPPELFGQLETYYRQDLPQRKLVQQLSAGRYVTDDELWRAYQDRQETATVDYVQLDLSKLQAPAVTDAEIRAYYNEHRDEFRRPEGARLKVAYIPLTITEADRQATVARARQLRQEILTGTDAGGVAARFAEVAGRESTDDSNKDQGGQLGVFPRGAMVASFDSAVFSLPVGQVSEPVITEFGVHLVMVDSIVGEQRAARHILLGFEKDEAELGRLEARLDSLAEEGRRVGLVAAARNKPGITVREGVEVRADAPMIPGVGAAMDAIDWAEGESVARQDGEGDRVSDVMDTNDALYVTELERYYGAGETPLAEATPSIRALLENQKRIAAGRAEGEKMLAEIRGGRTLEQVAQSRGLTVQRTGPFTRVDANPVFGQANAAIGASFGAPVGQVGPVAATQAGVYLIRPVARTQADRRAWEQQKNQQRQQAMSALQGDLFNQWLQGVRENAKIKDNRDAFRSRPS